MRAERDQHIQRRRRACLRETQTIPGRPWPGGYLRLAVYHNGLLMRENRVLRNRIRDAARVIDSLRGVGQDE